MAEVLTDERVGAVLRPFVRATSSVLRAMRESDPLGLRDRFRGDQGGVAENALDLGNSGFSGGAGFSGGSGDFSGQAGDSGTSKSSGQMSGCSDIPGRESRDESPSDTAEADTGEAGTSGAAENDVTEADSDTQESGSSAEKSQGSQESGTESADDGDTKSTSTTSTKSTKSAADEDDDPDENDPGLVDKLMRQIDGMQLPGSTTWDRMSVDQRCDWWVRRIGRFLALIASLPNFGGVITSRLPIGNALGVAGQGLVLCAMAAEHGVHDQGDRVRLVAKVLFERDMDPEVASGARGGSRAEDDARTAELSGELDAAHREHGRSAPKAVIRTVWRMARALWEIHSEFDKRPQGRFYHELIGLVPVVGVVGGYLGERSALRRVAKRGARWLRKHRGEFAAR